MSNRIWLGLFLIVFGFGFLLHETQVIDFPEVLSTWWPMILIIIGLIQIVNRTSSSMISGLLFLLVGISFLLNHLMDVNVTAYLLPLILIFIGMIMMFSRIKQEKTSHIKRDLNTFVVFSGTDIRSQSKNFQGGHVTAVFGGAEIDLRDAVFQENISIDLAAIFGGIKIRVPDHVQLEFTGLPIFGGWEDKTRSHGNVDEPIVVKLNCLAFCGGVEISN